MTILIITALIASIVLTLLMVPWNRQLPRFELTKRQHIVVASFVFVSVFVLTVLTFYISKVDMHWTVFIYALPVVTLVGAIVVSGNERKVKSTFIFFSIVAIVYMSALPLFKTEDKYQSAQMTEAVEIEAFDEKKTPASVPPQYVKNKMKKAFGQVPNTSFYELGRLQIQKVNGEYVYIAPVEFSNAFKWFSGKTTPGYFTMSATDANDNPKFIEADMTYVPSAYLQKNLERHMRMQYPQHIFYGASQLEIDEDGKPYYIRSYGEFIAARNGFDVKGIIMIDPQTGETQQYTLEEVPAFIDGAVSPETVSLQNAYYGKFVHGFWNSIFGKKDVKVPSTEGTEANVSPIFMEDGEMYYFTDFTSPKEGVDSMLGYSLTHARSGAATYYTGNLEASYMDSQGALAIIEKKFIEKQWEGEMPVLYNFYGEASWLAAVLDSNGFLQHYFIVSAANPEISAFASTPNEALRLYKIALTRGGSKVDAVSDAVEASAIGEVVRVYKERGTEATVVSFLLATGENFIVSTETVAMAIYLEPGDKVSITYLQTGEQFLPVKHLTIENLPVGQ